MGEGHVALTRHYGKCRNSKTAKIFNRSEGGKGAAQSATGTVRNLERWRGECSRDQRQRGGEGWGGKRRTGQRGRKAVSKCWEQKRVKAKSMNGGIIEIKYQAVYPQASNRKG